MALQAERQCRKLPMGEQQFSPEFTFLRRQHSFWTGIQRRLQRKRISSSYLKRLAKYIGESRDILHLDMEIANSELAEVAKNRKASAKEHPQRRATFCQQWAMAQATAWNDKKPTIKTPEQFLRQYYTHEDQRRDGRILRAARGKNQIGASAHVLEEEADGTFTRRDTKHELELACLRSNEKKIHQAKATPFLTAPLLAEVGPLGLTPAVDAILDGTYEIPDHTDEWARKLIYYLRRPDFYADLDLDFSPATYAAGWLKQKETTSASPYGLRFAHHRAHAQDEFLGSIDARLAEIAAITGYSPTLWQKGVSSMLLKKTNEFRVEKLQTILLYHAMSNFNNKKMGRDLLHHAELLQSRQRNSPWQPLAPEQYGSRKRHQAIDQCLNKRLTFDLSRSLRHPLALCANDAKSCYDRVVHSVATICLRRVGCPASMTESSFKTLQAMEDSVRTTYGDSESTFQNQSFNIPHGLGQGNGAGPTIWTLISTPILNMLRDMQCGAHLKTCTTRREMHFIGYSFVDDTDLVSFLQSLKTAWQTTAHDMQIALTAWEGGIRATGGAIVPEKSFWYLVDYIWTGNEWTYTKNSQRQALLKVRNHHGQIQELQRLESHQANATLGVYIAPDGNNTQELAHLRNAAKQWGEQIKSKHLARRLVWQGFHSTIQKTLEYPLPVTTLSKNDCNAILKPIRSLVLSQSGICRTMPLDLVHGPTKHQGLGIHDLYTEQGIAHLIRLAKYGTAPHNITGNLLASYAEITQFETGSETPFWNLNPAIWNPCVTKGWLKHCWNFCWEYDIALQTNIPATALLCENDRAIMDLAAESNPGPGLMRTINICRLYLGVSTLADIATGNGLHIRRNFWNGTPDPLRPRPDHWPQQGRPSPTHWLRWKKFLQSLCTRQRQLRSPLGTWKQSYLALEAWVYDPLSEQLFRLLPNRTQATRYTRLPSRPSRQSLMTFDLRDPVAVPAPTNPKACSVYKSGQRLHLENWGNIAPAIHPPSEHDFVAAILASIPHHTRWICSKLDFQGCIRTFQRHAREGLLVGVSDGSYKTDEAQGSAAWILCNPSHPANRLFGSCLVP